MIEIGRQRKIRGIDRYTETRGRPFYRPQPFWLPASNYYVLAFSISIATFFLIWGALHDGFEEAPWVKAGLSASLVLIAAVLIRFFVLRRIRERILTERRLDQNLRAVANMPTRAAVNKLSLEQNIELIQQIQEKSNAAKVLGKLAAAHREVVELCDNYIDLVKAEMPQVAPGSPRLGAFHKGKMFADEIGRKHLLSSVEIELKQLMNEAGTSDELEVKVKLLQAALKNVDSALDKYPRELQLIDSSAALRKAIFTARLRDLLQKADRAEFDEDSEQALAIYNDALFFISRNAPDEESLSETALIVEESIERLSNSLSIES